MRNVGVLCFVALIVAIVESRPSEFTEVISIENTTKYNKDALSTESIEILPSTEYPEVSESTEYAEVSESTEYTEVSTSKEYAIVSTSTEYATEATSTEYTEKSTPSEYATVAPSSEYKSTFTEYTTVAPSTQYTGMTEYSTMEMTSTEVDEKTEKISLSGNVGNVTEIDRLETTTEFRDVVSKALNLPVSTLDATEAVKVENVTKRSDFSIVENNSVIISSEVIDEENTTGTEYAQEEITTEPIDGTTVFGNTGESSTKGPMPVRNITAEDVEENTTDSTIGLVRLKKHESGQYEPYINASVFLPCFVVNAQRGITPFIGHPHDFGAELESWNKKNLPTNIAFSNNDDSIHFVDLTKIPGNKTDGLKVQEYGNKVSLYLYTRHRRDFGVKLSLDVQQILKAGFVPTHPTKVIAHGFLSNTNSSSVQLIKDAYFRVGDYNIISVDWSHLVYGFYSSAREEAQGVGDYLSQFLRFLVYEGLVDPRRLHLIGHSLGAHLAGFAGKRAHQDGWGIARITGLDPALPYFTLTNRTGRLDKSDADIVDVIHTCANFLGMTSYLGDIDFYPNEGTNFQPGCNLDVFGICSHGRAVEYFAESITEPTGFVGKFCDSERSDTVVKADHCPGEPIAVMGEWLEFGQPGRYVLRTASKPPFAVGLDILYPAYLYKRARMSSNNTTSRVVL